MSQQTRPPVIGVLGHVDHGKTSLLDYIRKTKVQEDEEGGITQHIGAYQAQHKDHTITFIDTPGHAAFSKMRSRGALVTDIVILVVAANDGVKPQTIESIEHIRSAHVPFIVAVNKIDLPDIDIEKVKQQLAEQQVFVRGYGGDVEIVEVSAKTGKGVDDLLETILLMAEILELQANPQGEIKGVVIESVKDAHKGPVATVLVQNGTIRLGDELYIGEVFCKIRSMTNAVGEHVTTAKPGMPVEILGCREVPTVGEFVTTEKIEETNTPKNNSTHKTSSHETLKLILRSDTVGTLEAVEQEVQNIGENIEIVATGIGDVTERDVLTAEATGAKIVGFRISIPTQVQKLAEMHEVKINTHTIIYDLLDQIAYQLKVLENPFLDEENVGEAEILQIFEMRGEKIAGITVTKGEIQKQDLFHIFRGEELVGNPRIKSLKQGKQDVEKIKVNEEAGIVFTRFTNFQVGDKVVGYKLKS